MQLMVRDGSAGPFLSQVISNALAAEQLNTAQLQQIKSKAVLMSLKFADKFYNKYKMHLLEQAACDVVGVVSLGLLELSDKDPERALALLLAPEGLVKPFQKGWSMLSTVSRPGGTKSLYGEVDAQLLQQLSSPPDAEDWLGWQHYQQALTEHKRYQSMLLLLTKFIVREKDDDDDYDFLGLEDIFANVVLYRTLTGANKVRNDLKERLIQIELQPHWFNETFLAMQAEVILAELPITNAEIIRNELGQHFAQSLLHTLKFAKNYQKLLKKNAPPEVLLNSEGKQYKTKPLLGWPQTLKL